MKKLLLFLLAISFANVSFGQKPTTLKENNLKGNVLLMSYGRFDYEEILVSQSLGVWRKCTAMFLMGMDILFYKE